METIKGWEAIDLFFLILALRIAYVAQKEGILKESFKTLSLIGSSLLSFHYYPLLSEKLEKELGLPASLFYFISFVTLMLAGVIFFFLLKVTINFFLKWRKEAISLPERVGAILIGGIRFAFASSLIVFAISLLPWKDYRYQGALSLFKSLSPKVYLTSMKLISRINPQLEVNRKVEEYR